MCVQRLHMCAPCLQQQVRLCSTSGTDACPCIEARPVKQHKWCMPGLGNRSGPTVMTRLYLQLMCGSLCGRP